MSILIIANCEKTVKKQQREKHPSTARPWTHHEPFSHRPGWPSDKQGSWYIFLSSALDPRPPFNIWWLMSDKIRTVCCRQVTLLEAMTPAVIWLLPCPSSNGAKHTSSRLGMQFTQNHVQRYVCESDFTSVHCQNQFGFFYFPPWLLAGSACGSELITPRCMSRPVKSEWGFHDAFAISLHIDVRKTSSWEHQNAEAFREFSVLPRAEHSLIAPLRGVMETPLVCEWGGKTDVKSRQKPKWLRCLLRWLAELLVFIDLFLFRSPDPFANCAFDCEALHCPAKYSWFANVTFAAHQCINI